MTSREEDPPSHRDSGPPSTLPDDALSLRVASPGSESEPPTEFDQSGGSQPSVPDGTVPVTIKPATMPLAADSAMTIGEPPTATDSVAQHSQGAFIWNTWQAGQVLGDYILLERLAQGGMGVVYKARQIRANRLVALKTIRTGVFASERELSLFQTEVEAVASLDHPNIVPIFEVGEHQGIRFYSMKLMDGQSLQDRLSSFRDRSRATAGLVAQTAGAIHHVHERGVLHRDLKPTKILVDARDQPHVIDFGLARRILRDPAGTSTLTIPAGTPRYMAPEQAKGRRREITTFTDVYGLGTILYAMLTGEPPFYGDSPVETLRQVIEQDPRRPSSLNPGVDKDLETICLKCLEKVPSRRYASARALADDLNRWLEGKSILARPVPGWQRLVKLVRRYPTITTLAAAIVLATTLGLTGIIWQWRRAEKLLVVSQEQEDRARREAYAATINLATRDWEDGNLRQVTKRLDATLPAKGKLDLRGFEWHYLNRLRFVGQQTLSGHNDTVIQLAIHPDDQTLFSLGEDRTIRVWSLATADLQRTLPIDIG